MAEGNSDPMDLSGVWDGLYSYPTSKPPVPFRATLKELNSWLDGVIEETGTAGDARGVPISAIVQGRRTGSSLTFVKLYSGAHRYYDSVNYLGAVNEEGTEIEGRWTISGNWSGTFLMIRSAGIPTSVTDAVKERA